MPKDLLIRMAGRIHRQLSQAPATEVGWSGAAAELIRRLRATDRQWQLFQQATNRGWQAAAREKSQQILADTNLLDTAIFHLRCQPQPTGSQSTPPTLATIVGELRQLRDEFEEFEIDLKQGLIGVQTPPIVLEDIDLGRFSIELHVHRLADRLCSDCFECIALDPNPAASNEDTVHPHVQSGRICAGDAATTIAAALKQGRIADAFVLVRSVLQTYNEDSPYVALKHWSGRSCGECGYLSDSESMYFCDGCEKDVCEDCYSSCDLCDAGCCTSCLERDTVSGNRCCSACRSICAQSDRTVDDESFDQETELCPGCLAKHQANQEQEKNHEPDTESVDSTAAVSPSAAQASVPTAA